MGKCQDIGRDDLSVHVDKLISAFRLGLATYIQEVMQGNKRKQQLLTGAGAWLTDIDPSTIKAFLDTTKA